MEIKKNSKPIHLEPEVLLGAFDVASQPGNEIQAMEMVVGLIAPLSLPEGMLERVKTAVAECTMNAMEHGNRFQKDIPVKIRVSTRNRQLWIQVSDEGGENEIHMPDAPDLEAKLAGLQSPRGWGVFLIEHMVDELQVRKDGIIHMVTLIFNLPGQINEHR